MDLQLMQQIEEADGRNEKMGLLATADERTIEFIRLAVDPYTTFGVTVDPGAVLQALGGDVDEHAEALFGPGTQRAHAHMKPAPWWTALQKVLNQLAARELTGNAAHDAAYSVLTRAPDHVHADWGMRVLHKDLRCGVNTKTVKKVWPDLVHPFEVMLAEPTTDRFGNFVIDPAEHMEGTGYFEGKLDGQRMVTVDEPLTRKGHLFTGVDHVMEQFDTGLLKDWVFDGEITGATREASASARRKHNKSADTVFHVFDCIAKEEWFARKTKPLWRRKQDLTRYLKDSEFIRVVPYVKVQSPTLAQAIAFRDSCILMGLEGSIWKRATIGYEWKRTLNMLKFKKFETQDLKVVGYEEGEGNFAGMLGAIVCELPNGGTVNVGSGFTVQERIDLWKVRKTLPKRVAEVKYQAVKTSNDSLSHPTFVRWRDDK